MRQIFGNVIVGIFNQFVAGYRKDKSLNRTTAAKKGDPPIVSINPSTPLNTIAI